MDPFLPQSKNRASLDWIKYLNTITRLPPYEYQRLNQSAAEIRLIPVVRQDDFSFPVQNRELLSMEDSYVQRKADRRTFNKFIVPD